MMKGDDKYHKLQQNLSTLGSLVVAFSGGVDSTFLLAAAKEVLRDDVLAVTVNTPYMASWEQHEANTIARDMGIRHLVIEYPIFPNIQDNPPNRCYLCKKQLFTALAEEAETRGYQYIADGTNVDDYEDIRPGIKALRELGVRSPLAESGLGKDDIRRYSKKMGLPTWNKPSYACLLSRLPFHTPVRQDLLNRIEQAEKLLRDIGFPDSRIRTHEDIARIEVPHEQLQEFIQKSSETDLPRKLRKLGYRFVTLDLEGYKMGSFNNKNE
jgi:pyridinium-3,5-biscarboxylic acid mononucleotide sulfurtransferase